MSASPYQEVVWATKESRIVCMDSMGHVDERNSPQDVLVCGSHSAACATQLVVPLRPRGLIGHAAGPGLQGAGVSGLALLDAAAIPAAAVDTTSAAIADGKDMFLHGAIAYTNASAESLGVQIGMSAKAAAIVMATKRLPAAQPLPQQTVVFENATSKVIAIDTVKYADERINGAVISLGSHAGTTLADYLGPFQVRGAIANDCGNPPHESATRGLAMLAQRGIPAAVVDNGTARVGDGVSTYELGVISAANDPARALGVEPGITAEVAAKAMLGV